MVEYEMADSCISQVLSQDDVEQAALFRVEGLVFAKLVHGALFLLLRKVICQNIVSQCSDGSRRFSMLCSSAVRSMLCSSAVRFDVSSGSADLFRILFSSSAPFAKALLFRSASFVARHNIPHSLV